MKVGLFFGSFNPIHIGHLAIANYMIEYSDMDELWFVVTPHNPLKKQSGLLADYHRYEMVLLAIEQFDKFRACNIEFNLPKPSFTCNTLAHIQEKYPKYEFGLIMGSDNLESFPKWKNSSVIIANHTLYIYPRPNHSGGELVHHPKVSIVEAPLMDISATFIRKAITERKHLPVFLPPKVWDYIDKMNFYR
jgi:nicotinate-nucleotide adenylyltransferase